MIRRFGILFRRDDITPEQFHHHWTHVHGPLAKELPGVRRYVEYHVLETVKRDDVKPGPPAPDGLTEICFDDMESMKKAFSSPEGARATGDNVNFLGSATHFFVEEIVVVSEED